MRTAAWGKQDGQPDPKYPPQGAQGHRENGGPFGAFDGGMVGTGFRGPRHDRQYRYGEGRLSIDHLFINARHGLSSRGFAFAPDRPGENRWRDS